MAGDSVVATSTTADSGAADSGAVVHSGAPVSGAADAVTGVDTGAGSVALTDTAGLFFPVKVI